MTAKNDSISIYRYKEDLEDLLEEIISAIQPYTETEHIWLALRSLKQKAIDLDY